ALCFGGSPETRWVRNLMINPSISVHLSSEAEAIILEGTADHGICVDPRGLPTRRDSLALRESSLNALGHHTHSLLNPIDATRRLKRQEATPIASRHALAARHLYRPLLLGVDGVGALRLPSPPTPRSSHAQLCTRESDRPRGHLARSGFPVHSLHRSSESDRLSASCSGLATRDLDRSCRRSAELRRIDRPLRNAARRGRRDH